MQGPPSLLYFALFYSKSKIIFRSNHFGCLVVSHGIDSVKFFTELTLLLATRHPNGFHFIQSLTKLFSPVDKLRAEKYLEVHSASINLQREELKFLLVSLIFFHHFPIHSTNQHNSIQYKIEIAKIKNRVLTHIIGDLTTIKVKIFCYLPNQDYDNLEYSPKMKAV